MFHEEKGSFGHLWALSFGSLETSSIVSTSAVRSTEAILDFLNKLADSLYFCKQVCPCVRRSTCPCLTSESESCLHGLFRERGGSRSFPVHG